MAASDAQRTLSPLTVMPNATTAIMLLRLVLATVFLTSGVAKAQDLPQFIHAVSQYEVLTPAQSAIMAILVVASELIITCSFLGGTAVGWGTLLTICWLVIFVAAQVQARVRGLHIACGCFGADSEVIGLASILRTSAFLGAALCLGLLLLSRNGATGEVPAEGES